MKKTLLSIALICFAVFGVAAQVEWNISNFEAGNFAETTTTNGLTIMAKDDSGNDVNIDSNTKRNGSYSFTQRLRLGGAGTAIENLPTARALSFSVSGAGDVTVACLSSSSGEDRALVLTNGTDVLHTFTAPGTYSNEDGANIPLETYNYTGGAATLYLYSLSSGINIYLINASSAVGEGTVEPVDPPVNPAQNEWNFSNFEADNFAETTTISGLTIMAKDDSGNDVNIDSNTKRNGSYSFTQRLRLGGAGTATDNLPTARALSFAVSGAGNITVACLSSSSGEDRALVLTNGTDVLHTFTAPGTYSNEDGANIPLETYNYTGGAATLYLYSLSSGVNVYLIKSEAGSSSISNPVADQIYFNGSEIINAKGLNLQVYNTLGKLVHTSNDSHISMNNLQGGIYIVRIEGVKGALKISK